MIVVISIQSLLLTADWNNALEISGCLVSMSPLESSMKLYRLIYMSDTAEYIDWTDLKDILMKSEQNNAELDITGLLIMVILGNLLVLEMVFTATNLNFKRSQLIPFWETAFIWQARVMTLG